MSNRILFVIGTDTGVGKTFLAAVLTQHLRERGVPVAALKPICSGGRSDARILRKAAANNLRLDEINPWHFRAPLAPLISARMEKKTLKLRDVVSHIRKMSKGFDVLV